ncbi:MAG: EAL domain-containing protein [Geobacter sp.]|nr:EAL domain-containing protein [Geobacter sp.]
MRHLGVIAEGVETEGQLEYLRSHACDEIQGFYFSRPVPAGEMEQLLIDNGNKVDLCDLKFGIYPGRFSWTKPES